MDEPAQLVPLIIVAVFVLAAALIDVWKLRVYNVLTIPLMIAGLAFHTYYSGLLGFGVSFGGMAFGFAVLLAPYMMGGMTSGDVKLLVAIGAWLGFPLVMVVFVVSAFASGLIALIMMFLGGHGAETWARLGIIWYRITAFLQSLGAEEEIESAGRVRENSRRFSYGAMVFLGVVVTLALVLALRSA